MQPRVKIGLIIGAIGLVLNIFIAALSGLCGPFVSLLGGAVAGFLSGKSEKAASKAEGARLGAISGAIASGMILIGQLIGAIGALAFFQFSNISVPLGKVPALSAPPSEHVLYYADGIGTGLCFGLVGMVLGSLTGAGAG